VYSLVGIGWRYGGLVVVAAVPVWLALRDTPVTPSCALTLTFGYALGMGLSPPGSTFWDAADLERLSEPTGVVVVENDLYIVWYMLDASVWTVGFVFLSFAEYIVRLEWGWASDDSNPSGAGDCPRLSSAGSTRGDCW
jgi:hypothetical protein